jgi:AraC family transcriptional regulator, regulatory protein of adaptative response / methylated-DNA-[protein]-cysteine methyltransferase
MGDDGDMDDERASAALTLENEGQGRTDIKQRRAAIVERACRIIEQSSEPPTLEWLAAEVGLSRHHFHRVFTAETGITPKAYADAHRAGRLRAALDEAGQITAAAYDAGFGSTARFYAATDQRLGMAPTTYRDGAPGVEIRFAIGESSLGSILVGATERGVCAIYLGDDPELLIETFQDRFHAAELVGDDPAFGRLVAQVVAMVEDPAHPGDLPLDIRGTAFQERVWRALRQIPAGTTVTYTELAAAIGAPTAVRAVAGACAANHLAVAIPCHRVVRTDGSLSGYRWGVERKRALLDRERS